MATDYRGWVTAALVTWAKKNGSVTIVGYKDCVAIYRDGVRVANVVVEAVD